MKKKDLTYIFVYGTLMKGQPNHNSFLRNSTMYAEGRISGYEMYDLGSFPGIVAGDGDVIGEVYAVTEKELAQIDCLEGEGFLYLRTPVTVYTKNGESIQATAYVYNRSVDGCPRLYTKYGQEEYVWYVSYGSNMLEERLGCYIKGGYCSQNGREYSPCTDTSMPEENRSITLPYDMYYSNYDRGAWPNSAVCFLDLSKPGMSYGRAYKIKKTQLREIHRKEGKGRNWYPECISLGYMDGLPVYTFAGYQVKNKEKFHMVSSEYALVLFQGMKETYPEMSDTDIIAYLRKCGSE